MRLEFGFHFAIGPPYDSIWRRLAMGKYQALREQLLTSQENAQLSLQRAVQKEKIVANQQGNLWNALAQEFITAISEINIGSNVLSYSDSGIASQFVIKALRPNGPQLKVALDDKSHRVKMDFTGVMGAVAHSDLFIQANDDNQVEFFNRELHHRPTVEDIVGEALSRLT
jgi:hypothetical protein